MHVFVQDTNVSTVTEGEMFRIYQQGPINVGAVLKNAGTNNLSFRFQESADSVMWSDITGASGTLLPSGSQQVTFVKVSSALAIVRVLAVGDSILDFGVSRYFPRSSSGALPLINL